MKEQDTKKDFDMNMVKELWNKCVTKVKENKRYACAAVLLIVFCVVMIVAGGKKLSGGKDSASGDVDKFEKNANKQINTLIENYYKAYATGSEEKVCAYAVPISENEASYMKLFSEYVESYDVKNVYTHQGVDSNSYLVSVEMAIKFKDVQTEAPGLDFFYVTGVESGELYIVNLYSQFNERTKEYVTEEQIEKCIKQYEAREEVKELQAKVQAEYEDAVASDEALDAMVNVTIQDAVEQWMSSISLEQGQTPPQFALGKDSDDAENDDQKESSEDGKAEEEQDESEAEETVKPEVQDVKVVEYVETKEEVNLREGASTKKDSVCMLEGGVKLKVISMSVWGDWTYVKTTSGKKGYVRNDFLKTCDNDYTVAGQEGYPEKKQKCELLKATNLMSKMTDTGKVISSLSKGTKVKVITCYVNGFSKVTCNGRTGYVLTENLEY